MPQLPTFCWIFTVTSLIGLWIPYITHQLLGFKEKCIPEPYHTIIHTFVFHRRQCQNAIIRLGTGYMEPFHFTFCFLRICVNGRRLNALSTGRRKCTAQNTKQQQLLQSRHTLSTGIPTRSYPYMGIFLFDSVTSLRDAWAGADAEAGGVRRWRRHMKYTFNYIQLQYGLTKYKVITDKIILLKSSRVGPVSYLHFFHCLIFTYLVAEL